VTPSINPSQSKAGKLTLTTVGLGSRPEIHLNPSVVGRIRQLNHSYWHFAPLRTPAHFGPTFYLRLSSCLGNTDGHSIIRS
jgi:hypothetical protein